MSDWTPLDLLLTGGIHEIIPVDRPKVVALARRWSAHPSLTDEERQRIQAAWVTGKHVAPYNPPQSRWDALRVIAREKR